MNCLENGISGDTSIGVSIYGGWTCMHCERRVANELACCSTARSVP